MLALAAAVAELRDGGGGVGQQAFLICGIDPGARYHSRAVARSDLVLLRVDERIERSAIDQSLFDEQRFERLDTQSEVGRNFLVIVIVWMMMGFHKIELVHGRPGMPGSYKGAFGSLTS